MRNFKLPVKTKLEPQHSGSDAASTWGFKLDLLNGDSRGRGRPGVSIPDFRVSKSGSATVIRVGDGDGGALIMIPDFSKPGMGTAPAGARECPRFCTGSGQMGTGTRTRTGEHGCIPDFEQQIGDGDGGHPRLKSRFQVHCQWQQTGMGLPSPSCQWTNPSRGRGLGRGRGSGTAPCRTGAVQPEGPRKAPGCLSNLCSFI